MDKLAIGRRANKFLVAGQYDKAIKEYEKLIKKQPQDPGLLNTLGDLLLKVDRPEQALVHFRQVAENFIECEFLSAAVGVCRKVHQIDPGDEDLADQLLELFDCVGRPQDAADYVRGLVEKSRLAGRLKLAIIWQKRLLGMQVEPLSEQIRLADLFREADLLTSAADTYDQVSRKLEEVGKLEAALTCVQRLLDLQPNHEEAKRRLEELVRLTQPDSEEAPCEAELEPPEAEGRTAEPCVYSEFGTPEELSLTDEVDPEEPLELGRVLDLEQELLEGGELAAAPPEEVSDEGTVRSFELGNLEEMESADLDALMAAALEETSSSPISNLDESIGEKEVPPAATEPLPAEPRAAETNRKSSTGPEPKTDENPTEQREPTESDEWQVADAPTTPAGSNGDQIHSWLSWGRLKSLGRKLMDATPEASPSLLQLEENPMEPVEDAPSLELPEEIPEETDNLPRAAALQSAAGDGSRPADPVVSPLQEPEQTVPLAPVLPPPGPVLDTPGPKDCADAKTDDLPRVEPTETRVESAQVQVSSEEAAVVFEPLAAPGSECLPRDERESKSEQLAVESPALQTKAPIEETAFARPDAEIAEQAESSASSSTTPEAVYGLGVAYREMELLEEAVSAFSEAFELALQEAAPGIALSCAKMLASSHFQMSDYREAIEWANRGLEFEGLSGPDQISLEYDLARALEGVGDIPASIERFRRVLGLDPSFRDVRARKIRLEVGAR